MDTSRNTSGTLPSKYMYGQATGHTWYITKFGYATGHIWYKTK